MGYQIQKYKKNEGKYTWHTDNLISNNYRQRLITFLFYLNDIDKGGETDFHYKKIISEQGNLYFFQQHGHFHIVEIYQNQATNI